MRMTIRRWIPVWVLFATWGCATTAAHPPAPSRHLPTTPSSRPPPCAGADSRPETDRAATRTGLLLMAHGAGPEWNARVAAAAHDLRDRIPTALAFGMANPHTLQAALDSLQGRCVEQVAVVRLFVSGASFLHQTEYLFGLRSDPPRHAMMGHRMVAGSELAPLEVDARIALDRQGLVDSEEAARILRDRARAKADRPAESGVLLLAHGLGAEEDNRALLVAMERSAAFLKSDGFAEVRVAALREDWAAPRAEAEKMIRREAARMAAAHSRLVVVPFRVFGFGPYAAVLNGIDYAAADGLLPHSLVAVWIARRATAVLCAAGSASPLGPCDRSSAASAAAPGSLPGGSPHLFPSTSRPARSAP